MAKIYKCMNVGDCSRGGQEIQVSDGDISPVCPECHQLLVSEEITETSSNGVPKLAIISGVAVFILAAIGGGAYLLLDKVGDTADKTGKVVEKVGDVAKTGGKIVEKLTNTAGTGDTKTPPITEAPEPKKTDPKIPTITDVHTSQPDPIPAPPEETNTNPKGLPIDDQTIQNDEKQATDATKVKNTDEAEKITRRVMANNAIKLAVNDMVKGDYENAKDDLNRAKNLDAENPLIYYNFALISLHNQNIGSALEEFKQCFDKATSNNYEAKYREQIFKEIKSGSDLKNFRKTKDGKKLLEMLKEYENKVK